MTTASKALIQSLKNAPLLGANMPNACVFDRSLFSDLHGEISLNFDQKLGHLYEDALKALINESGMLELLGSHVQIFDENRKTIGELDFILFDKKNKKHIHLELAVKFYLAIKKDSEWIYPGPNASDNWQRKLNHMMNHQFILSQRPEAKTILNEKFDIRNIETKQLVYGCIFNHINFKNAIKPAHTSNKKRTGTWLKIREFYDNFSGIKDVLFIPKSLWPVEITTENKRLFEKTDVPALLKMAQKNCTMFTLPDSSEIWFVTPDDWAKNLQ